MRLGWKSNSTTLYTMVVVAVCVRVDPRKILIGALATHGYVLVRTASTSKIFFFFLDLDSLVGGVPSPSLTRRQ